ncbi:DNA internalization-related competence protein ComEC/Rec2 [Ferrimonas sediminicola]|uniref:DNA internalization-related competence protein ComEC/Rec2 n=1 Tax=Ferrimonas sediminicola TaxID=2569538 RepID=UPI00145E149F|nr:DNA internalization-related competence protein ComEC/Rec2 [Ferrimonas sediminicola]
MNRFLLGWVAAVSSGLFWPALLPPWFLVVIGAAVPWLVRPRPLWAGLLLGVCWFAWHGDRHISAAQPLSEGEHLLVARLITLPTRGALYQRTLWQVERIDETPLQFHHPDRIWLSYQGETNWQAGHLYRLKVTLRPPMGTFNQFSWNQRRHALANRVVAQGRILAMTPLAERSHWRVPLAQRLEQAVADLPRGDLLRALAMADRRGLTDERWAQLRAGGLTHLVAISGLHLSLVALLLVTTLGWLARCLLPSQGGAARLAVLLVAAFGVTGYALLAGLGLATQRALIMALAAMLMLATGRFGRPWELLLRAAALLLLLDPLVVLGPGYWLSCCAVAAILLLLAQTPQWCRGKLARLVWIQCGLTLLLGLVQLGWFGSLSLHALWANLLMVPWVSLVALPLTLVAALMSWLSLPAADLALRLADGALWPLASVARLAHALPGDNLGWPHGLLSLALVPIALWLIWRPPMAYARGLAPLLLLPAGLHLLPESPRLWRLHVLDVRQGLSVVVEKQGRAILYDTGAAFPSGFSYAERVVTPFLRGRGIGHLDYLVLSHRDNDHAGGAGAIHRLWPEVNQIAGDGCTRAPTHWQGLTLAWQKFDYAGNNGSCMLRISDGHHSVLLPGDIEATAEARMRPQRVTVLVSPHHGSRSSSTDAWARAVAPSLVIHAAGWRNRWGFPHPEVLVRYRALGARQRTTGRVGQVSVHFRPDRVELLSYSERLAPYWYNQRVW